MILVLGVSILSPNVKLGKMDREKKSGGSSGDNNGREGTWGNTYYYTQKM